MTRTKSTFLALLAVLLSPMAANADPIVYEINLTIGGGSAVGFIETDGTIGALISANITDWHLTLTSPNLAGGSPSEIDIVGSILSVVNGSALEASLTQLLFDFGTTGLLALQGSNSNYLCVRGGGDFCGGDSPNGIQIGYNEDGSFVAEFDELRGISVIGQVAQVPEPGTLALLAIGLLGMGAARRRKKA